MLEMHTKPGIMSWSHTLSRAGRAQAEDDRKKWMLSGRYRLDRREGFGSS